MNSDTWVKKMHLEDKTGYLVGFPKSIGFVPVSEEVLFIEPDRNPWLDDFFDRRSDEIDALFANRKYHFCYIPNIAKGMDVERLEYNRPNTDRQTLENVDPDNAVYAVYRQIFDEALTPLPEVPILIRYKEMLSEVTEASYAYNQGREANYVFSYIAVPDTEDEDELMDFFDTYSKNIGEESIYYCLKSPEQGPDRADREFESRVTELEEDIKNKVEALRQLGVTELVISSLFQVPKPKLSRLTIAEDFRLFLTDYGNREVKMTVLPKVLFFFYLNHPEGVTFKELSNYEKELLNIYKTVSNRNDIHKMQKSIRDLVNSTKNSINEKASLIRSAFISEFDEEVIHDYILSSDNNRNKMIMIDRNLVVDESGQIMKKSKT